MRSCICFGMFSRCTCSIMPTSLLLQADNKQLPDANLLTVMKVKV